MGSYYNLVLPTILLFSLVSAALAAVTYDNKGIIINGRKRILVSGSIHYPRSTPDMWPDLIWKAKQGGIDVIQTYVFWNGHEPEQGKYYFEDRFNLVQFIKLVQKAGLYVHLRIGPYACAEWNYGGFPIWLKHVPGIDFRTDNGPFKAAMQRFTTKIVDIMKAERLYEPQGGPIILSQIENEYELVEFYLGNAGKSYAKWAAGMAVALNTGVPWVMCKQGDAPDPIINACNGFYCEGFWPNAKYKPKMWTEIWTAWLTNFGGPAPYRPAEDVAFAVARFVQNSGTYFNYYMYHGGTNFGRTSGGPFIATSYDYDAPIDEYGLLREPKWSHLRSLHMAIKQCETALVSSWPTVKSLGKNQESHVFWPNPQTCAAFLANYDPQYTVNVTFQNLLYTLPPWSISILPDCKKVVFNTAQISPQVNRGAHARMVPAGNWGFSWESYTEPVTSIGFKNTFTAVGLKEQLSTTWDKSDYLWYMTDININGNEGFLKSRKLPWLTINSAGHAVHVFLNGELAGTAYGSAEQPKFKFGGTLNLRAGVNKLSLLSVSVGLANIGLHFENWNVGILGPVTLSGLNSGTWDMSKWKWTYKVGVTGEDMNLFQFNSVNSVKWASGNWLAKRKPLTWYKTSFNAPAGNEPLALDMNTMSKGQIWVNGRSIGRHWPQNKASGKCGNCNYAGQYTETKCLAGCGQPSQRWYHVPRSWLFPNRNLLVVFEEWGGDPTGISFVKRVI